ncbi:MAG: hypothetical protein JST80_09915 [Bdellovibrionales bacterium]|nr:hypothetical protein [Bdellovibrionales bacterium]
MKTLNQIMFAVIALTLVSTAQAGNFKKNHPRRAEVNERVRNQRQRIHEGVKNGTMTKDEAKKERQDLRNIKAEEHAEVKANGGHITKAEQKDLNQQLNQNSKDIYQEKHDAQSAPVAPATTGTN